MLPSASTRMPPTGTQCPLACAAVIRDQIAGWCSLTQAYCCADEQANLSSG